jgi:hypothetical protein
MGSDDADYGYDTDYPDTPLAIAEKRAIAVETALRAAHTALRIARPSARGFAPGGGPPVVSVVDDALALIVAAMPELGAKS